MTPQLSDRDMIDLIAIATGYEHGVPRDELVAEVQRLVHENELLRKYAHGTELIAEKARGICTNSPGTATAAALTALFDGWPHLGFKP